MDPASAQLLHESKRIGSIKLWQQQHGVELASDTSREKWEDICAYFPSATAFHRYDFLESVASPLRCNFIPLMVFFCNRPVGVAPLMVKRLGPFCTINWVPFPYLGPLVPPELISTTLSALRLEAKRRRALNHQQSFSHLITDSMVDGFKNSTDRTFVIPLSGRSDEDLLAAMHSSRRRGIRRAERAGIEVGPAEAGDFSFMDRWLSQVYAAQGLPIPYPDGTYQRLFQNLHNAPGWTFLAARLNGRPSAVLIALSTANRAFAWQYAMDPSDRSVSPQDLLLWRALIRARDSGTIEFDFVGTPNDGIAVYKSRFGAVERHYSVLQRRTRSHRMAVGAIRIFDSALE